MDGREGVNALVCVCGCVCGCKCVVFTPVVLVDEVETKTHEEDEETLYEM